MAEPITIGIIFSILTGVAVKNVASEVGPTSRELRERWESVYVESFFHQLQLLKAAKVLKWSDIEKKAGKVFKLSDIEALEPDEAASFFRELIGNQSYDTFYPFHMIAQTAAWASMGYHAPVAGVKAVGRGIGKVFGFGKEK